jgi:aryl-alcohol dehydrogenase-like predicted oxidoreductase
MEMKMISRKKFVMQALSGIAGINLLKNPLSTEYPAARMLKNIGNTKIAVTPVCMGASRTNEESIIRYAIEKGINFIDTGRAYSNGRNELLVGRSLAGNRKNIVIQSKIRLDAEALPSKGKGKKGADEIRNMLNSQLEESMKALNTDYIDVVLYHDARVEDLVFHPETMKFFSGMKQSGAIKAFGFSAHNDYMNLHQRNNTEKFYEILMVPFNHKGSFIHSVTGSYSEWNQAKLTGILEKAGEKGIGIVAMKTCSGGKYSPGPGKEPSFKEAVKWVLQKKYISAAAVAMSSFEQVDEHINCLAELNG